MQFQTVAYYIRSDNLDSRNDTVIANIDFAKAFDSISVPKLLHKLSNIGLSGNLLSCIASFFTPKQQRVRVGDYFSEYKPVISGVAQGSVLGPILFIFFINDVCNFSVANAQNKLYADDLKNYASCTSLEDFESFNAALFSLHAWATTWQLPISFDKCNYMLI